MIEVVDTEEDFEVFDPLDPTESPGTTSRPLPPNQINSNQELADILEVMVLQHKKDTSEGLHLKLWETAPPAPLFYRMLGQTHVNGWSRVIASQNGGSTSYIFPLRLRILQWSRHLFNYWKNKKTIIERFLIINLKLNLHWS